MLVKPHGDKGGFWGGSLFSLGGHMNPADVDLKNRLFGQVVFQQGSLTGRRPAICQRGEGPAPVYLPCTQPSWVSYAAPGFCDVAASPTDGVGYMGIAPSLDSFTVEFSALLLPANTAQNLIFRWLNDASNGQIEVNLLGAGPTGARFIIQSGFTFENPSGVFPATGPNHRICLMRTATTSVLFIDGIPRASTARTTAIITMTVTTNGFMVFELLPNAGGTSAFSRLRISDTDLYPATGYDPTQPAPNSSHTLLNFTSSELTGQGVNDRKGNAELDTDPVGSSFTWLAPSTTVPQP